MEDKGISRRGFLAGSAALGALSVFGLGGCAAKDTATKTDTSAAAAEAWKKSLNVDIASVLPGNTSAKIQVAATKECDIVVLGAGCSGTNTALRAAEKGKKVILVEKTGTIGGACLKSSGPIAPNSRYAIAEGVKTDINPLVNTWVADSHWRVDSAAIQQLLAKAGEAVDWMTDNGWVYKPRTGTYSLTLPEYSTREPLFKAMIDKYIIPRGGEVLTETTAKQLITDSNGVVTGALVTDKDGKGIQINAKAVVIATGGYAGNREMVKTIFRFDGVLGGLPQNIGEGLEMAWKAGAQKPQNFGGQMLHQTLARATDAIGKDFEPFPAKYPMILCYVAKLLNVGASGARFRNEDLVLSPCPSANSSAYQGSFHYVVVSKTIMDILEKEGLAGLKIAKSPGLPPAYKPAFELNSPWKDITKVFDAMVEKGAGFKGDTPKALAEAAGMDPDIFTKQFEQYESYCAKGIDAQFGKTPENLVPLGAGPYYIIISEENSLGSWGGLLTNTDYEVLDYNRLPVKGLYAVGNEAGSNLYNDTYVGSGVAMANTITSGYICGTKLAERL